jgi:predicted HicB family RNase H-like nuclease
MKKLTISIDDNIHKQLKHKAIDENTTLNKLIHQYIKDGLGKDMKILNEVKDSNGIKM